jgi:hypothetical protein
MELITGSKGTDVRHTIADTVSSETSKYISRVLLMLRKVGCPLCYYSLVRNIKKVCSKFAA